MLQLVLINHPLNVLRNNNTRLPPLPNQAVADILHSCTELVHVGADGAPSQHSLVKLVNELHLGHLNSVAEPAHFLGLLLQKLILSFARLQRIVRNPRLQQNQAPHLTLELQLLLLDSIDFELFLAFVETLDLADHQVFLQTVAHF